MPDAPSFSNVLLVKTGNKPPATTHIALKSTEHDDSPRPGSGLECPVPCVRSLRFRHRFPRTVPLLIGVESKKPHQRLKSSSGSGLCRQIIKTGPVNGNPCHTGVCTKCPQRRKPCVHAGTPRPDHFRQGRNGLYTFRFVLLLILSLLRLRSQ